MFYAFGGSKTLVKYIFFIMILTMRYTKTLTGTKKNKKNKPLDAPNMRQAPKKTKKTKIPATTQKWTHSSWNFCRCHRHQKKTKIPATTQKLFLEFLVFLVFFGLCRFGVWFVFFVFFGACAGLVTLTSQNIDRHQKKQKKQTTRWTKHRQAPKKTKKTKIPATTQKWTHSSWNF